MQRRHIVTLCVRAYLDPRCDGDGVFHDVSCDGCDEKSNIRGTRWKCVGRDTINLCYRCYMSNKYDLSHEFIRYDTPDSAGYKLSDVFIVGRGGGGGVVHLAILHFQKTSGT